MDSDCDDDPRVMELETLQAIYPELTRLASDDDDGDDMVATGHLAFELEIPVVPKTPAIVIFGQSELVDGQQMGDGDEQQQHPVEISHLPSLLVRISLPKGYPEQLPPQICITTTPSWLKQHVIQELEQDGLRLWDETGRDVITYSYIDHIQNIAEDVFGLANGAEMLEIDAHHKLAVLDYNIMAKKAAFDKETFECGICLGKFQLLMECLRRRRSTGDQTREFKLKKDKMQQQGLTFFLSAFVLDPKKGSKCHKMIDCGHIFCAQCLQDFYNDAILNGHLSTVRCLTPNCAKERAKAIKEQQQQLLQSASKNDAEFAKTNNNKKPQTFVTPSELLQIGLSDEMVKRFVMLKYKTELESDKNTIYCPRSWCNGAARSKRHRKPEGLEFQHVSDNEDNEDNNNNELEDGVTNNTTNNGVGGKPKSKSTKFNPADLLAVCEDCNFAFCSRCLQSWHGEFVRCSGKRNETDLTEEEKLSVEYLKLHTSPCPTCGAPAQKTHGCNHMLCSRCETHFCYLCSAWLDPGNPYKHYNSQSNGKVTSCYMRLWELEGGDGDDVGLGYQGGQAPGIPGRIANPAPLDAEQQVLLEDEVWDVVVAAEMEGRDRQDGLDEDDDDDDDHGDQPVVRIGQPGEVALEAPLVLRLFDDHQVDEPRPDQQQPQPPPREAAAADGRVRQGRGGQVQQQPQHQNAAHAQRNNDNNNNVYARARGAQPRLGGAAGAAGAAARGQPRQGPVPRIGQRGQAGPVRGRRRGNDNNNNNNHDNRPIRRPEANQHIQRDNQAVANEGLDPEQAAWVRRFVEMALEDVEDQLLDDDLDDEDDANWVIQ